MSKKYISFGPFGLVPIRKNASPCATRSSYPQFNGFVRDFESSSPGFQDLPKKQQFSIISNIEGIFFEWMNENRKNSVTTSHLAKRQMFEAIAKQQFSLEKKGGDCASAGITIGFESGIPDVGAPCLPLFDFLSQSEAPAFMDEPNFQSADVEWMTEQPAAQPACSSDDHQGMVFMWDEKSHIQPIPPFPSLAETLAEIEMMNLLTKKFFPHPEDNEDYGSYEDADEAEEAMGSHLP
jgi:hypothetical protein